MFTPGEPLRLERSCASSWLVFREVHEGISFVQARLDRDSFSRHAHDTYTLALTREGLQEFAYRGAVQRSHPGQIVVLHPGEAHDGRPGRPGYFGYQGLHLAAGLVAQALSPRWRKGGLPFVRQPVVSLPGLRAILGASSDRPLDPLAAADLVVRIANELEFASGAPPAGPAALRDQALDRCAEFLAAHATQVVNIRELEGLAGLSVYEFSRQFRRRFGTSPYRFLMLRRVELARRLIDCGRSLAQAAAEAGFADQAHLGRSFKSLMGLTPGTYDRLRSQSRRSM